MTFFTRNYGNITTFDYAAMENLRENRGFCCQRPCDPVEENSWINEKLEQERLRVSVNLNIFCRIF